MVDKHFSVTFKKKINKFNKSVKVDSDKSISQRSFIIGSVCEGVFGKSGCLDAVSPEPVTAHDINTLLFILIIRFILSN